MDDLLDSTKELKEIKSNSYVFSGFIALAIADMRPLIKPGQADIIFQNLPFNRNVKQLVVDYVGDLIPILIMLWDIFHKRIKIDGITEEMAGAYHRINCIQQNKKRYATRWTVILHGILGIPMPLTDKRGYTYNPSIMTLIIDLPFALHNLLYSSDIEKELKARYKSGKLK